MEVRLATSPISVAGLSVLVIGRHDKIIQSGVQSRVKGNGSDVRGSLTAKRRRVVP